MNIFTLETVALCQGPQVHHYLRWRDMEDGKRRELMHQFRLLKAALKEPAEGLWGLLSEELLCSILIRLPIATQFRFRCVSSRWRGLLPIPFHAPKQRSGPPCAVISDGWFNRVYSDDWFFCQEEKKWYPFPFQPRRSLDNKWVLVGSDGGLLCYEISDDGYSILLICNPMTGSYKIITPDPTIAALAIPGALLLTNFFVDLERKTFKLVFMSERATVIYDSNSTPEWKVLQGGAVAFPALPKPNIQDFGFVWKNKIYKRAGNSLTYLAFDMESGVWSTLKHILPRGCNTEESYHLGSWKDQVLLVQLHPNKEDPVRIWMLRENATGTPSISASSWDKVSVEIPDAINGMLDKFRNCLSRGHEYVAFTTLWTHQWVQYTFRTRTWDIMPRRGRRPLCDGKLEFVWFNFEPQACMGLEADRFKVWDEVPSDFDVISDPDSSDSD